jgi:aspartyl-tRNA(Asn)/glutamyl-tRNA(Gln) amidotransferase subunit A
MAREDLLLRSASQQARLVASGALGAQKLLQAQLAAIDEGNAAINAYVAIDPQAKPSAGHDSSPLAGTGLAVKDNIDVQGFASHNGLRAWHAQAAVRDATVVARLRAAGMVPLGKLNMHAMALGATNHNVDFGNCLNPHRTTHTPGGSSGGSGAAVAAGLCAIALGTDTMGSVRVPAAYCGTVGFKPGHGEMPMEGVTPLCRLLDQVGLLARSVEDVVHALALVRNRPAESQANAASPGNPRPGGFTFAIPSDLGALGLEPAVREAFDSALARLRGQSVALHPIDLHRYPFTKARQAGLLLCEAELRNTMDATLAEHRAEVPADLLAMVDFAAGRSATDLARALATVVDAGLWVREALRGFDGLLLPTAAQTAFAMDAAVPPNQADFTAMANMSGGPAISLPLRVAPGALPVGLQLIGHRCGDDALLAAAQFIESVLAGHAGP